MGMGYRLFGHTGLRVSELCLGTMTFGQDWGWGASEDECRAQYEAFREQGGNFIDTANKYTDGSSERILGRLVAGHRDEVVLATKYTLALRDGDPNSAGSHRKNLVQSVEASLERLGTDRIDILWVHAWDELTPVAETMRALDDLVRAGSVLYVGVSDWPAWAIARATTMAELRGWTPFSGIQVEYSLVERTPERELLPMARALDMAVTAWSPLGQGVLTGKYSSGSGASHPTDARLGADSARLTDRSRAVADVVVDVARDIGATAPQVALAWLRGRGVAPIIGGRTREQLVDNLGCLDVELSPDALERLDHASRIELGFPHDFLRNVQGIVYGDTVGRVARDARRTVLLT